MMGIQNALTLKTRRPLLSMFCLPPCLAVADRNAKIHRQPTPARSRCARSLTICRSQFHSTDGESLTPAQAFDHCTQPLGALRQNLFSCLTCNPPPESPLDRYNGAAVCYSCSIACHGEHELVELFNRRNFTCDCGTTRLPATSPCTLRIDPATGIKGPVHSQPAGQSNTYNQNFRNRFCGCGELYDAHTEKGTMFQCLGLAGEDKGGCGEDWWHPECILGLGRNDSTRVGAGAGFEAEENHQNSTQEQNNEHHEEDEHDNLPPGFPKEDDFETFICYKCVDANSWIKRYAASTGFLPPVFKAGGRSSKEEGLQLLNWAHEYHEAGERTEDELRASRLQTRDQGSDGTSGYMCKLHRSRPLLMHYLRPGTAETTESQDSIGAPFQANGGVSSTDDEPATSDKGNSPDSGQSSTSVKRRAEDNGLEDQQSEQRKRTKLDRTQDCYYESLPKALNEPFSLFLKEDFRDHFCRCAKCYPDLRKHPQLLEEEESYEPPLSENGEDGGGSVGTGSY